MLLFVCIFSLFLNAEGLKVLMYATALARSHMKHAGALVDALAEKGHTVDFLIQNWHSDLHINGTNNARHIFRVYVDDSPWLKMPHMTNSFGMEKSVSYFDPGFLESPEVFCEALIADKHLIKRLKNEDYDILLSGLYDSCGFGLAHLLGIRAVSGYTATPVAYKIALTMGIPVHPSYISNEFSPTGKGDRMSFWDRWENFKFIAYTYLNHRELFRREQQVFDRRFKNFPSLESLVRKMTFLFVNTNEIIDLPKPVSAKVQYIGGIAMRKPKPVDEYYDKILSIHDKGTILFSFGSIAKSSMLPEKDRRAFLTAFSRFPEHTFIWKYDDDDDLKAEIDSNFTNVFTVKWLPQTDLLYDDRIKLFISHMGLNSLIEATHAGIPLVAIPLFGDQAYNAECALQNGVAVKLNKKNLTADNIYNAIHTMLQNPIYTARANEIAAIMAKRPEDPRENFVRRVEMAAEFPHLSEILHLRVSEVDFTTYFLLDILAMILGSLFFSLIFIFITFKFVKLNLIKKIKPE